MKKRKTDEIAESHVDIGNFSFLLFEILLGSNRMVRESCSVTAKTVSIFVSKAAV